MENSNEDSREIIQMKRLPLCLNLFNMWMADRAWVLKFLPFQGRVMTKNTGLVHSARYLASHCFRLPFLKKKKKSQLHPLDSTGGMLFGNKLLWNVARKLKAWNVFILSIYTLLFLSLLCMNKVTWIRCSVTVGSVWGRSIALHGHQTVSNELSWFPNQMSTGQYYLTVSPYFMLRVFCKESFVQRGLWPKKLLLYKRNLDIFTNSLNISRSLGKRDDLHQCPSSIIYYRCNKCLLVFTLWKLIRLYTWNLCTFLLVLYFNKSLQEIFFQNDFFKLFDYQPTS